MNNKKYDFNTKVAGNITLYADWRSIELPKPTLSYENFEQLSIAWLNKGKYTYNLLYNKDEYISKCKDLLPQGFEIYEKVNNKYNKIDDHTINQATNYVELEPGVTKMYAIRIYAINSSGSRVYSAYSNTVTINAPNRS